MQISTIRIIRVTGQLPINHANQCNPNHGGSKKVKERTFMSTIIIIIGQVIIISLLAVAIVLFTTKISDVKKGESDLNNTQLLHNVQQEREKIMLKQQENITSVKAISDNLFQMQQLLERKFNELELSTTGSTQILSNVSQDINEMNRVMINKKSRGNWGEYQLDTLLSIYCGESKEIYQMQYTLGNGMIGDAALKLPGNKKILIVDSKFPMENYVRILDSSNETDRTRYSGLFKTDIKKHIDDIMKKYITKETVDLAVMFIPSEAIYTYICAENEDLVAYAHTKHILLTSPTTLLGVVFTLINATKDFNRSNHIKDIEKSIILMADDARRLGERMDKVQSSTDILEKSLKDARISADKISNRIQKLADGYVEEKEG